MAVSGPGSSLKECQESTLENAGCALPKIAVYESGGVKNCYCSSSTKCQRNGSTWQMLYELHGTLPIKPEGKPYPGKSFKTYKETCQCQKTNTCTKTPSTWQDTYVQVSLTSFI
jgi:hypothetical protein